jgi:precorrin-6B methylase 2
VLNAVTLETIGELKKIKEQFPEYQDMEIISVQVNRSQPLGHYQFLKAENPVYIVSFGGDRGRKL